MKFIVLKFHEKRCNNCRYYRIHRPTTNCLLLGRTLSVYTNFYTDMHRVCDGWKRLPSTWDNGGCGYKVYPDPPIIKEQDDEEL